MASWKRIKAEYIAGGTSYRKLADKYGVSFSTLRKIAAKEKWSELRNKAGAKRDTKIVEVIGDKEADRAVDKLERVSNLTDRLLEKLEKAIEELDVQICKDVVKVKEIEYHNDQRPDKPTKETVREEEKITEVKTIIDRSGLKAIASSLRDIKEIQMLRSDLDNEEQKARIAKLQRDAEREGDTADGIEIVFHAGSEAWSE